MRYSLEPKAEVPKSKQRAEEHAKLVQNNFLRDHLQYALLEYQKRQTALNSPDLGSCAACHLRTQGAVEFVDLFLNLTETVALPQKADLSNLPSNVRSQPKG